MIAALIKGRMRAKRGPMSKEMAALVIAQWWKEVMLTKKITNANN